MIDVRRTSMWSGALAGLGLLVVGFLAPAASASAVRSELHSVVLHWVEPDSFGGLERRLGDIADGDVLDITVMNFVADATGRVELCGDGSAPRCSASYPVTFNSDGYARFQYRIVRPKDSACATAGLPCRVRVVSGDREASLQVWFDAPAPAIGEVMVSRRTGLRDGDEIEIKVTGLQPGQDVIATMCAAPARRGIEQCGAPAPEVTIAVDAQGSGSARYVVRAGPTGSERIACGRGSNCAIAVLSMNRDALTDVRTIEFARREGANYVQDRLIVGLGLATALIVAAFAWNRRVDWSAVGDAAAPEIDEAEYADLDAIVAELDRRDAEVQESLTS